MLLELSSDFELNVDIKLDAGFKGFNAWCRLSLFLGIPLSLFFMLGNLIYTAVGWHLLSARCFNLGDDAVADSIDIIANDVEIHPDDKWNIKFRHPTIGYGHDKSLTILSHKDLESPPLLFLFGKNMSAARHANVLFVKQKDDHENDLAAY
ncbi:hypothetical protein B0H13DRAFT_2499935 [Mycena leptocephala]|nr:hypothetical protein B0H13DRAFT_2499935 [Mycena leptocephala]